MDSKKLNDWLQVIGLFALVGSLLFVGLQMRQTQEIALSQAYQARAEASMNGMFAFVESDTALSAIAKVNSGQSSQLTPIESQALRFLYIARFVHWENVHFQYQQGFVSQEHWITQMAEMRRLLPDKTFRTVYTGSPDTWRSSFAQVIEQIVEEID